MVSYRQTLEHASDVALTEGRTFNLLDKREAVSSGENFLFIKSPENDYQIIIDQLKFYASATSNIKVYKNVDVDTQGTEVYPVNLRTGDKAEESQFQVYKGGVYSGRVDDNTSTDYNVVSASKIESQSGGFLSSVGDEGDGEAAVLGEQGGNILIVYDNVSGSDLDEQRTEMRIVQEQP